MDNQFDFGINRTGKNEPSDTSRHREQGNIRESWSDGVSKMAHQALMILGRSTVPVPSSLKAEGQYDCSQ